MASLHPGAPFPHPVLDVVMRQCSLDRVLAAGPDATAIVDWVQCLGGTAAAVPDGSVTGIITGAARAAAALPADVARFSTAIVGLDRPIVRDDQARELFAALHRAAQTVFLSVSFDPQDPHHPHAPWERLAFACGFRLHPLRDRVSHAANGSGAGAATVVHLLLEAGPGPGPEPMVDADGHARLSRYAMAASFIRRNDRVLDLDAGDGAGLIVMARAAMPSAITGIVSRDSSQEAADRARERAAAAGVACDVRAGDTSDLSRLAGESIDVIVSCRSLPIGRWSAAAIDEVLRVLTPGGRLICGSTGMLSTDDREARRRLEEKFLVEYADDQWSTVVLMKDPFSGNASTYRNRWASHAPYPGGGNPTAYVETFDNPWLFDSVFLQGSRIYDGDVLERLCNRILSENATSYDAVAAACVLGYRLLDAPRMDLDAVAAWLASADRRIETLTGDAPATIRWRVSMRFLAGRLAMRAGRRDTARRHLHACAWDDATKFSSLLGTRTTEAAYWLGMLAARDGDTQAAAAAWRRGVTIASECLRADAGAEVPFDQPLEMFGFREFSQVLENAGRCAAGLNALSAGPWWEERLNRLGPAASAALTHLPAALAAGRAAGRREIEAERAAAREEAHREARREVLEAKVAACEALLRHAVHTGRRTSRKLLVWGAGAAGLAVLQRLTALGGHVDAFIDRNPAARGGVVADLPVYAPEVLRSTAWRGALVIVASQYASEIEASLIAFGFTPDADFVSIDQEVLGHAAWRGRCY